MYFPGRLPQDVTSGIREKGCNTGTFWKSLRKREVEV